MTRRVALRSELARVHPFVKRYVARIEGQNLKLRRRVRELNATLLSLRGRMRASQIETAAKKNRRAPLIQRDDANW